MEQNPYRSNRRNALYLLLIVLILAGTFTGRSFFFTLSYVLTGLFVLSLVWAWLSVRWLALSRRSRTRRTQVGQLMEEAFQVRNTALLPKLWLEILDDSELPGHSQHSSQVIPLLGTRGRHSWQASTYCAVRGEFRLGPMTLISGDPFGFFLTRRWIPATSRVIVYPQTVDLDHFSLPEGVLSGGETQRRRSHYVTTNAAGVRDYVTGDSYNRIHWKSTARKGRLIVKEFEIDPLVDIWLFVDFSAASLTEPHVERIGQTGAIIPRSQGIPPSTEEYAAVIAASLARYFVGLERALGFAAYTPNRAIHQPERGSRQLNHILETLAVARSFSQYTLAQMLALETPYFTRGTTLIVITSSLETRWVAEAQTLLQRGIRPVCVFVDPQSFGGPERPDEVRAYLHAARIPTVVVRNGDDISSALAQRVL